jgi:hypothetical protein
MLNLLYRSISPLERGRNLAVKWIPTEASIRLLGLVSDSVISSYTYELSMLMYGQKEMRKSVRWILTEALIRSLGSVSFPSQLSKPLAKRWIERENLNELDVDDWFANY